MKKVFTFFIFILPQIGAIAAETAKEVATDVSPYLSEELKSSLSQNPHELNIFSVICSLLFVLALIYGTGYLYKKLIKFNSKIHNDDTCEGKNEFKVLAGTTLGQGKFLHVVEINETYLVLGSTPNNISLLKEFKKSDVVTPAAMEAFNENN